MLSTHATIVSTIVSLLCLILLLQAQAFDPRLDHHNPKSLIRPEATGLSNSENVEVLVDTTVVSKSGEWIEVSWCCVKEPKEDDWLGVYAPADADPRETAPVMFFMADSADGYLQSGRGTTRVQLFHHQTTTMRIALMQGGLGSPALVGMSTEINIQNENEPVHGHLALTGIEGEMLVQWTTKDVHSPKVVWGEKSMQYTRSTLADTVTYTKEELCGGIAQTTGWMDPGVFHQALLTDLVPGRKYHYKFGDEVFGFSEEFSFTAPPAIGPDSSVKFIAFGDMGAKEDSYNAGAANTTTRLASEIDDYQLIIHNGDVGYAMGFVSTWNLFMHGIQPLATKVPYMTAVGNHERDWPGTGDRYRDISDDSRGECGVAYKRRFKMPTPKGEHVYWYSFDFGPVHFLIFDTEDDFSPGSPQYSFILEDLKGVDRENTPWLIAVGHRPVYINSNDFRPIEGDHEVSKDLQESLEALFYTFQVNIVLQGHNHSYQRTCPVYKGRCRRKGQAPVYVDVGNAGAGLCFGPKKRAKFMEVVVEDYGYSTFSANATDLYMQSVLSSTGATIDSIHLEASDSQYKFIAS